MDNKIKKMIFKEMVQGAIANINYKFLNNGRLTIDKYSNATINVINGNNEVFITYVPYDITINDEVVKLNGNTRNSLAKKFIEKYSSQQLYEIRVEKNKQTELRYRYQQKVAKDKMNILYNKLNKIIPNELIEEMKITFISRNVYEMNVIVKCESYLTETILIEKCYNNDLYSIYTDGTREEMTEGKVLELFQEKIEIWKVKYDKFTKEKEKQEKQRKLREKKEDKKRKLREEKQDKIYNIYKKLIDTSGNKLLILKKNNSYVVFTEHTRYSISKNSMGKIYYHDGYRSLLKHMIQKDYHEYIIIDNDYSLSREEIRQLDYNIL